MLLWKEIWFHFRYSYSLCRVGGSCLAFCLRTHSSNFFIMSLTSNGGTRSWRRNETILGGGWMGGMKEKMEKCFQSIESERRRGNIKERSWDEMRNLGTIRWNIFARTTFTVVASFHHEMLCILWKEIDEWTPNNVLSSPWVLSHILFFSLSRRSRRRKDNGTLESRNDIKIENWISFKPSNRNHDNYWTDLM